MKEPEIELFVKVGSARSAGFCYVRVVGIRGVSAVRQPAG